MPLRTSTPAAGPNDQVPRETLFCFPLSVATEATAVAVNIDGQYHVQQLLPFRD
jgi:hypothetical protein